MDRPWVEPVGRLRGQLDMRRVRLARDQHRYLDGIRGFAALIVVFGHCSNAGMHIIPGLDVHSSAKTGVWLFFVLSAFLLTKSLTNELRTMSTVSALIRYAARRVFRIMPLYCTALFVLVLARQLGATDAILHIMLIEGFWHLWTIPVEMKFYLLLPFVVGFLAVVPDRFKPWDLLALLALSALVYGLADPALVGANSTALANYLPFFIAGIAIGAISFRLPAGAALALGVSALIVWPFIAPRPVQWFEGGTMVEALKWSWLYAPVWAIFILSASSSSVLQRVFGSVPLAFVGRISFGIYLIHFHIILLVAALPFVPRQIGGVLALALSVLVAAVCFYFIEKPALATGTRWAENLIGRTGKTPRVAGQ